MALDPAADAYLTCPGLRGLALILLALSMPQRSAASEILQASTPVSVADAGYSVGVSGGWVAVGAPGEDDGAGAVYMFDCRSAHCSFPQRLQAAEPDNESQFGAALALEGDTLAVGIPGDGKGRVAVFERAGTNWIAQAELDAFDGEDNDRFGNAVALTADRLLVGAAGSEQRSGSAYVFERVDGEWQQATRIAPVDGQAGDRFGAAVALHGDVLLLGAPYRRVEAADGVAHGAAYVYVLVAGIWSHQQILQAELPAPGELFGWSVALSSDVAVVGAPLAQARRGAVDAFSRIGPPWTHERRIEPSAAAEQRFGWSVALDDETLLAGAPFAGADASAHCGATLAYVRDGGAWSPIRVGDRLPAPTELAGWSVALDGPDRVIGAPARALGGAPHAGIARRIMNDQVLFRDDYESVPAVCAVP